MENKRMPKLRFPDFVEIQPFIKFKELVESNIYGPRFNANDYNKSGNVKTIRGTDVSANGEFKYKQVPVAQLDKSTIKNHRLRDGDLVMITTADCGLTGVFREQEIDYVSSAYGVRIRLNAKGNPYYFKYFFQTRHAKKEVASFVRKATVANLPGSDILRIRLNLPTLPEQTRIATFLTAVDKRIHLLQKKKAELEQYKKGAMQKLFSVKPDGRPPLRFKNEHGNDFPDWEEKKLGELAEIKMGQSPESKSYNFNNDGLPLIQGNADIQNRISNPRQWTNKPTKTCDIDDLILTVRAPVGAISKSKHNACIGRGVCSIRNNKFSKQEYLFQLLLWYEPKWKSIEQGSTFTAVSGKDINNLKFTIPISLSEQQKIANFLSSIDTSIEKLSHQIEDSILFKKGLLQKMFV